MAGGLFRGSCVVISMVCVECNGGYCLLDLGLLFTMYA